MSTVHIITSGEYHYSYSIDGCFLDAQSALDAVAIMLKTERYEKFVKVGLPAENVWEDADGIDYINIETYPLLNKENVNE